MTVRDATRGFWRVETPSPTSFWTAKTKGSGSNDRSACRISRRAIDRTRPIAFSIDRKSTQAFEGDSVASAMAAAGVVVTGRRVGEVSSAT
jgi:2Fe-2S iron-sulfur cluster binding domain